ncbi:DUF2252 domain-containing protein [Furfurilactobacillus siliginis]|uniref:DUF2252 domain-containing protein n=1 Tax=Furfurilactobacillus siliginis TaxID=348151 RepID=A0A0R2LFA0_9LACO|nr:DUF2252 domain-containing protein [Furfurilactobacillus siliginis]KRN97245.1 hypothetical protein IV55_GL000172 [Furfurilactobacillus siliginis]GEK29442.1 hypothetical protein LSI01_17530 [Furfurilactobacillus siliginis]
MANRGFDISNIKVTTSQAELIEQGHALRKKVSFEELGTFTPVQRDPLLLIQRIADMLVPELLPERFRRMGASSFTFFRGTAELMAHDLNHQASTHIPVVISGDAHLGNFGFFASPERQFVFDLNDFDEAGVNSWERDVKRLAVSAILAGQEHGFGEKKLHHLARDVAASYQAGISASMKRTTLDRFYPANDVASLLKSIPENDPTTALVNYFTEKASKRNSEQVVKKFTQMTPDGLRFVDNAEITKHTNDDVTKHIGDYLAAYRETARTDIALMLSQYSITDVARHCVGVGSFGSRCYLVLLTSIDGSHLVLQIKEALPTRKSGAEHQLPLSATFEENEGRRIIDAQKILQSASDPFLGYFQSKNRSFYVRQFRDMKTSVDLTTLDWSQFQLYAAACGRLLAIDHCQTPTAPMIAGYLGDSKKFPKAIADWAQAYIEQVTTDYAAFLAVHPKDI